MLSASADRRDFAQDEVGATAQCQPAAPASAVAVESEVKDRNCASEIDQFRVFFRISTDSPDSTSSSYSSGLPNRPISR